MKHRMKVDQFDVMKHDAICHLIGEYQRLTDAPVDTRKIADFMGVTKPTAIKYLNMLQSLGRVSNSHRLWRSNAFAYEWSLTERSMTMYQSGLYEKSYRYYHAQIIQIAQMRGKGKVTL